MANCSSADANLQHFLSFKQIFKAAKDMLRFMKQTTLEGIARDGDPQSQNLSWIDISLLPVGDPSIGLHSAMDEIQDLFVAHARELTFMQSELTRLKDLAAQSKTEHEQRLAHSDAETCHVLIEKHSAYIRQLEAEYKALQNNLSESVSKKECLVESLHLNSLKNLKTAEESMVKLTAQFERIVVTLKASPENSTEIVRKYAPTPIFGELFSKVEAMNTGFKCALTLPDSLEVIGSQEEYYFACKDVIKNDPKSNSHVLSLDLIRTKAKDSSLKRKLPLLADSEIRKENSFSPNPVDDDDDSSDEDNTDASDVDEIPCKKKPRKASTDHKINGKEGIPTHNGKWQPAEIEAFANAVAHHGNNWKMVANEVKTRNRKQCQKFSQTINGKKYQITPNHRILDNLAAALNQYGESINKVAELL